MSPTPRSVKIAIYGWTLPPEKAACQYPVFRTHNILTALAAESIISHIITKLTEENNNAFKHHKNKTDSF